MRSMKRFLAAASALTMALSISGTGIYAAEPAVTTAKPAVTTTAKTTVKTVSTTAAKTTAAPAATTIPTATKPAETTVSTKRYISHNAMDIKEDYPAYMAKLAEMPEKEKMIKLFSDVIKLSSLNMRQEAYITNVYDGGTVRGENGDPEITPNNGRFYYDFGMNEIFMAEAEDGADRLLQQQRVYYNYYSMKYDLLKKQTVTKDEINAFLKKNFPKAECLSVTEYETRELIGFEGTRPKYSDKTIKTTPYMFINYKKGITRSELLDIALALKEKFGIHPTVRSTVNDVAFFTELEPNTYIDTTRKFDLNNKDYQIYASCYTPVKDDGDKLKEMITAGAQKYGYDYEPSITNIYYSNTKGREYNDGDYRFIDGSLEELYTIELKDLYAEKKVTFGTGNIDYSELNIPEGSKVTRKNIEDYLKANKFDVKVLSFGSGIIKLEAVRNDEYTLTHDKAVSMAYGLYKKYGIFPTAHAYSTGASFDETSSAKAEGGTTKTTIVAADNEPTVSEKDFGEATLKGDTDLDGKEGLSDVVALTKYLAAPSAYPLADSTALANADMNGDRHIDTSDSALLIEENLAG